MEVSVTKLVHPCIRCDFCAPVCPEQLQPQQLYAFSRFQEHDLAQQFNLAQCTECGACETVCPSELPLVAIFREEKLNLLRQEQADQEAAQWQQRFERHQARTTDNLLAQQERKLKKLQNKSRELAEGRQITRPAVQTDSASPVAGKTPAQIQADIAAAVERARARKAALQNDDSGKHKP
jgi:electron transport complex protein RnfC